MIRVTNTEHLAGITISGTHDDMDQLVDAMHAITANTMDAELEKRLVPYINISLHVLGITYDIRHAAMGDREILRESNGIDGEDVTRYACNVLYPEAILVVMALNELTALRMRKLSQSRYDFEAPFHKDVVWDRTILSIRLFQSSVADAVGQVLTPASFTRWRNIVHDRHMSVHRITHPFVDTWNLRYLDMAPGTRAKKLLTVTKRFAEHETDPEDLSYRRAIDDAMQEYGWAEEDIRFSGLDYPEEIEW
jgi:hypothetical protein